MRWRGPTLYLAAFLLLLLANDGFHRASDRTLIEFTAVALFIASGHIWELRARSSGAPEVLERLGREFNRLENSFALLGQQLADVKADCEALRQQSDRAAKQAWSLKYKDELTALAPELQSPDVERSAPALSRYLELLKKDPP